MPPWIEKFLQAFIPMFVAIDAIGLAAIFLGLGQGIAPAQRQRIARQATITAGGVSLLFLFLGAGMFKALGIAASDFQIAGGLILFILASRELIQSSSAPAALSEDFGVVPLGMPLIAGPALITTLIAMAQTLGIRYALAGLAANLLLVILAFTFSERLGRMIGTVGLRAISKIIAMLLAAIAVNMVRVGLRG